MASSYSPRLTLPEMADGELAAYVTYNDLIRMLELYLQPSLITTTLVDPPVTPPDGSAYYVPEIGATGAWVGHGGELAQWYNGQWYFHDVPTGFDVHDQENNLRWTQGKSDPYIGHVSTGFAGLVMDTPMTPQDIVSGGSKITTFDSKFSPSVDAEASIANSTITALEEGLWVVNYTRTSRVESQSSNSVREYEMYFYDETLDAEVPNGVIGGDSIARYSIVSNVSGTIMVNIDSLNVNHEFSIRARSITGGTITVDSIDIQNLTLHRISQADVNVNLVYAD